MRLHDECRSNLREDVQDIVRNMAKDIKNISSSVNAFYLLNSYYEKLREALRKDAKDVE